MEIERRNDHYTIKPEKGNLEEIQLLRDLPSRRFDPKTGLWRAPVTEENWEVLCRAGVVPPGAAPTKPSYRVSTLANNLLVEVPYSKENVALCRAIPEPRTWKPGMGWSVKPTRRAINYIVDTFPNAVWDEKALMHKARVDMLDEVASANIANKEVVQALEETECTDFTFATVPFENQRKAFLLSRDREFYGLLMEQGTGKTKVAIDTAVWLWKQNKIDGVLVIAPNSVKSTWCEEIGIHMAEHLPRSVWEYSSKAGKTQKKLFDEFCTTHNRAGGLSWLVTNVEGYALKGSLLTNAEKFLKTRRCMFVVDESTKIKNPKAKRTKHILKLADHARYRRILTGTPVTNSPLDAYTQMKLLDEYILGFGSYYAFRNHFALMGGYGGHEILGYVNLDELQAAIAPHTYRVLRKDCLDLPPKMYTKRWVDMTEEQAKHYKEMKQLMYTELDGEGVSVAMIITQMIRLQQIISGYLSPEEGTVIPIPGKNPKLDALMEIIDETEGKMIIWARFRPEIEMIHRAIAEKYGPETVVQFHGGISTDQRTEARQQFQNPKSLVRFFVANPAAGGMGITLTQAQTVVYFSNSFSLEDRLQSEDRAHRIGQKHSVLYIDLLMNVEFDKHLISALRNKQNIADAVTGDGWKEWL